MGWVFKRGEWSDSAVEAARKAMINAPLDGNGATFLKGMQSITRHLGESWNEHNWKTQTRIMARQCVAAYRAETEVDDAIRWPVELEDIFHRVSHLLGGIEDNQEWVVSSDAIPVADIRALLEHARKDRTSVLNRALASDPTA